MVKAVQELKKEKDAEIAELRKTNESLEQRLLAQGEAIESLKELTSKLAAARTDSHAPVVREVASQPVYMP
jgi:ribonuclease HI